MSGRLHAPGDLPPRKNPCTHRIQAGWASVPVWTCWGRGQFIILGRIRIPSPSACSLVTMPAEQSRILSATPNTCIPRPNLRRPRYNTFDSEGKDGRNQISCNSFGCTLSVLTDSNLQLHLPSIVHALGSASSVWRDFMKRLSPKRCVLFSIYSQSLRVKLRKAPFQLLHVLFVCPLGSHWTDCSDILILKILWNSVGKIQIRVILDDNTGVTLTL